MDTSSYRWLQLQLRDESDQTRLDFIRTDLEVCQTLAATVEAEYNIGYREHAERTLAEVEKGYSTLLRLVSQEKRLTAEVEEEFQSKLLRRRLDGLQAT